DLIYYSHPQPPGDLPLPIRLLWRAYHLSYLPQRLLLNRADAVAAVSETTRDLIVSHRLTTRPVHVVSNAAEVTASATRTVNRHEAKTLIYMGAFLPYKNVESLIRALEHLPGRTLHIASRSAGRRAALATGLDRRRRHGRVPSRDQRRGLCAAAGRGHGSGHGFEGGGLRSAGDRGHGAGSASGRVGHSHLQGDRGRGGDVLRSR